jgi:fatty acid desaturase
LASGGSLSIQAADKEPDTVTSTPHVIPAIAGRIPGRAPVDWPTMGVAAGVYSAFLLLTWNYAWLPWWVIWPLGAITVTLHGSLQHEATHGYPTKWEWVNSLIVGWPLWLWLSYFEYRNRHRLHHRSSPHGSRIDPDRTQSKMISACRRPIAPCARQCNLGGRMIIGPAYFAFNTWRRARARRGRTRMRSRPGACMPSASASCSTGSSGSAGSTLGLCAVFAYPGTSLTVLRSFAEHRAAEDPEQRTVICESGWFWSALFLNNNLHKAHHDAPGDPWHKRPTKYRRERERLLALNGGYLLSGYGIQFAKYFVRAKEPIRHPFIHGA